MNVNDIQQIYLSLPIASCLISRDMTFIAANERYAELMSVPLAAIVGNNMHDINPCEHINNVRRDFKTIDSGENVADHEIVLGEEILLVSVKPFIRYGDERFSAISVTLQNITRRKKAETELIEAHQRLLEAKRLIDEIAHTDSLTGLPNRRSFDDAMKREIGNSRRSGSPLALVLADVDDFKFYNDMYGHVQGDKCLSTVAQAISSSIRKPGDFAARYGGEEFVVLLPQTDISGAFGLTDLIRRAVQALGIEHARNADGVVTASFGVVGLPCVPLDMDTDIAHRLLLEAADAALYDAKAAGRNAVSLGNITL